MEGSIGDKRLWRVNLNVDIEAVTKAKAAEMVEGFLAPLSGVVSTGQAVTVASPEEADWREWLAGRGVPV